LALVRLETKQLNAQVQVLSTFDLGWLFPFEFKDEIRSSEVNSDVCGID